MNIYKLTRVAMGVALATASLSVLATPPAPPTNPAGAGANAIITGEFAPNVVPPTFNRAEQTGLCLMESVVSLLASRTNDFGCSGIYTLDIVTTDNQGVGFADIAGGAYIGGTTLNATLGDNRDIGTRCNVTTEGFGVATDNGSNPNLIGGLEVTYNGAHGWSRTNEIFNSDAYITIKDAQTGSPNYYREVDIKDFFKQVINGRSWEFDWGLEDIKKRRTESGWSGDSAGFYYPVQKWQELSWYQHENGEEGGLYVHKYQMIPRSARGCRVEYTAYDLFNGSGEFETHGIIKVSKRTAGPI